MTVKARGNDQHHALLLYDYHEWANRKVIDHIRGLPDELWAKKVQSVFSSIQETFLHMIAADTMWLDVMKQKPFKEILENITVHKNKLGNSSLEELAKAYSVLVNTSKQFFLQQNDLERLIICDHPSFGRLETPLSQCIQHVVNHGTYHRGNLASMIRQHGFAGVQTDYITFLYNQK
ncbi:DinB family protein [Metabacillus sp. RGM 3146]|uniref:DinB family protein n=1 Tax=Metabacillus sp. RGM 3146 TaxID=3401092 RepID=UPI003B994033